MPPFIPLPGFQIVSDSLKKLKLKRVRTRTGKEKRDLLNLPKTLALLEVQIQSAASELGSQEFLELTGLSGRPPSHSNIIERTHGGLCYSL